MSSQVPSQLPAAVVADEQRGHEHADWRDELSQLRQQQQHDDHGRRRRRRDERLGEQPPQQSDAGPGGVGGAGVRGVAGRRPVGHQPDAAQPGSARQQAGAAGRAAVPVRRRDVGVLARHGDGGGGG